VYGCRFEDARYDPCRRLATVGGAITAGAEWYSPFYGICHGGSGQVEVDVRVERGVTGCYFTECLREK
jgi:hypothetical protein